MRLFDWLLDVVWQLVWLLLCCSLALFVLRSAVHHDALGLLLVVGLLGYVLWHLRQLIQRAWPTSPRRPPARPELPRRSQWIGPRRSAKERRW